MYDEAFQTNIRMEQEDEKERKSQKLWHKETTTLN